MSKPKAQTIQQRFGFQDPELSTPAHDELMIMLDNMISEGGFGRGWSGVELWKWDNDQLATGERLSQVIDREVDMSKWEKVYKSSGEGNSWLGRDFHKIRSIEYSFKRDLEIGIDLPSCKPIMVKKKVWEYPIMSKGYTVGFADMHVEYESPILRYHVDEKVFQSGFDTSLGYAFFEVKPEIRSAGELIRQIRMYQSYTDHMAKWYVYSPDTRFKDIITAQDIGFIEAK